LVRRAVVQERHKEMKLVSATILVLCFTFSLLSQETTNNVPEPDERSILLENAPLFICLDVYSELTGKKIKNETTTPVGGISLRTENSIPKLELVKQLEMCLNEKGIKLIPSGTNELRAVTIQSKTKVQQRDTPNHRSPSAPAVGGR